MLTYLGGAICEGSETAALNGLPRKVIYTLECGDAQDNNVTLTFLNLIFILSISLF
jgi:hypothetical protein